MLSTQKVSINGEDSAIKADRALLVRLLVIREKRGASIKKWLQYSLGPIAWSLGTDEGNSFKSAKSKLQNVLSKHEENSFKSVKSKLQNFLATHEENIFKSVKSKLQNVLEEKMSLVDCVPQNCSRTFDGMCIVQQLTSGMKIFGCLQDFVVTLITNNPISNIFFTTDQCWNVSIKLCDRNRRATSGSIRVNASIIGKKLSKQLNKYLSIGLNKQDLIDFLLDNWSTHSKHHQLIRNKTIHFTTTKNAFKLNVTGVDAQCQSVIELSSNQERPNTKAFLVVSLAQEFGCTDDVIYTVMWLSWQCITIGDWQ